MERRTKAILVLGTSSFSGKTTLAMALCRYFSDRGYRVSPFKSVNMSLNSVAIPPGREISRSVYLQAVAARAEPSVCMNPYLIKPEAGGYAQLIEFGNSRGIMEYKELNEYMRRRAGGVIQSALHTLAKKYDVIIAEGAGSPAELNFSGEDYSNTYISSVLDTAAVLVGDIDRGGVFASLYGTLSLMKRKETVRWLVINKMRGNDAILAPGIKKLEALTGRRVIGVLPFIGDIMLPGEDGLNYETGRFNRHVAVVRYPFMENYSDLDPLFIYGTGANLIGEGGTGMIEHAHLVLLPGSKRVDHDLYFLRKSGIERELLESVKKGATLLGICGGYQMLGNRVTFQDGRSLKGLSLLNVSTIYSERKTVRSVEYEFFDKKRFGEGRYGGYEIHYGITRPERGTPFLKIGRRYEGMISEDGRIIGTNVHGVLENLSFLRAILPEARLDVNLDYSSLIERSISKVTSRLLKNLDTGVLEEYVKSK
jgi:adenosylcobyric acid synthase